MKNKKITKNVIQLLAKRSGKTNKFRNRIIIIAITLTTLLLTVLFTVTFSMNQLLSLQSLKEIGTIAEGAYKNVTLKQYNTLQNSGAFLDISYNIFIGNGMNSEFGSNIVEIRYTEKKAAGWNFCQLEEGHFPVEVNEIVVDDLLLEYLGNEYRVGDKISLQIDIGERVLEKEFVICGYYQGNRIAGTSENYVSSAFMEKEIYNIHFKEEWKELEGEGNGLLQVFCRLDSTNNAEEYLQNVWNSCGFQEEASIAVNWGYESGGLSISSMFMIFVILAVIMFSGYLMIYNIFYISVVNDVQFYGRLKLIGMENKQICTLLNKQVMQLYWIGMPIGLIVGWGIGNILLPKILLLMNWQSNGLDTFHPLIFIFSILFTAITVCISMRKPLKMISKISPIKTISYTGIEGKRLYTSSYKKQFSIANFAFRNIKRSKKKTGLVMLSVGLVLVLFVICSSLVKSVNFDKFLKIGTPSDIFVSTSVFLEDYELEGMEQKVYTDLNQIQKVSHAAPYYYQSSLHLLGEETMQNLKQLYNQEKLDKDTRLKEIIEENNKVIGEDRYYFDDETIQKFDVIEGKIDTEKLKTGEYVILVAGGGETKDTILYHVGDKVVLSDWTDESSVQKTEDGSIEYIGLEKKEYTVLAVVESYYSLSIRSSEADIITILPLAEMAGREDLAALFGVGIDTDSIENVTNSVERCIQNSQPELSYKSVNSIKKEFQNLRLVFVLTSGGLTMVIGIMALINFINNSFTSVIERKKEFSTLRAVGMTKKQLLQMLKIENFYIVGIASVIGLMIGLFITKIGFTCLETSFAWLEYRCNLLPVCILILLLCLLAESIPVYIYSKIGIDDEIR